MMCSSVMTFQFMLRISQKFNKKLKTSLFRKWIFKKNGMKYSYRKKNDEKNNAILASVGLKVHQFGLKLPGLILYAYCSF